MDHADQMNQLKLDRLVDQARRLLDQAGIPGLVEVDDIQLTDYREATSEGEDGTWVRAWVLVPKDSGGG